MLLFLLIRAFLFLKKRFQFNLKFLILLLSPTLLVGFQNCTQPGEILLSSRESISLQSSQNIADATLPPEGDVILNPPMEPTLPQVEEHKKEESKDDLQRAVCVQHVGQKCKIPKKVPGCANPGDICTNSWAVYYNSTGNAEDGSGCEGINSSSFIEQRYNAENHTMYYRGMEQRYDSENKMKSVRDFPEFENKWIKTADDDLFVNLQRCTFLGGKTDSHKNPNDPKLGLCYKMSDSYDNHGKASFARVVEGEGCFSTVNVEGTYSCEGTCQ
jgi:hypothetical protein